MEISQGNSLCGYLYLKQAKISFFLFFFYKEQEGRTGGRLVPVGGGRWRGKEGRRVNMVQKCVHMYVNTKMIPVETVSGITGRREGDKGQR
jgi:hypothetical protein